MSFNFMCPYCRNQFTALDERAGQMTKCPKCHKQIVIQRNPQFRQGQYSGSIQPKSRLTYILLGVFLGGIGIHDFYAGYTTNGWIKVGITVLSCCMLGSASWIWAIVDVCTIKVDANGHPFEN